MIAAEKTLLTAPTTYKVQSKKVLGVHVTQTAPIQLLDVPMPKQTPNVASAGSKTKAKGNSIDESPMSAGTAAASPIVSTK